MIRKHGLLVLIGFLGAALLASTNQVQGQGPPPGGRGPMMGGMMGRGMGGGDMRLLPLLNNEKVQKELELVDDQKTKLKEAEDTMQAARRESFAALQDLSREERMTKMQELMKESQEKVQKTLAEVLLPKQLERLKEIQLQDEGPIALANPDVIKALTITSEQQDKIKTLTEESFNTMREAMAGMRDLSREERQAKMPEMQEKMQKMNKELGDKLLQVLTQDQRDQFEKMKGAKLDIDFSTIMRPMGGRGGPGGPPPGGPPPGGPPPGGP